MNLAIFFPDSMGKAEFAFSAFQNCSRSDISQLSHPHHSNGNSCKKGFLGQFNLAVSWTLSGWIDKRAAKELKLEVTKVKWDPT
jgi:hypothetical protein